MNIEDSKKIIETILTSMRENPAQFQFNLKVQTTGAMGIGGSGGHGIVATANAPGSVGFSASASSPTEMTMKMAEQHANKEIEAKFLQVDNLLQQILLELERNTIDNQKRESFIGQLKSSWIPNMVVSLVSLALSATVSG